MLFDYAKVRLVVEDRRSALAALAAALSFITRNPGAVLGLYALNALVFVLVLAAWALLAPGAGGAGLSMWLAFAISQVYVLARLALKLQFMASQTALFQGRLAHAAYTAAPAPTGPNRRPPRRLDQIPASVHVHRPGRPFGRFMRRTSGSITRKITPSRRKIPTNDTIAA